METAVSAPGPSGAAGGGRSNGVRPSLSSDFLLSVTSCCPPVSEPHATSWPHPRATNIVTCGEALKPDVGLATCCFRATCSNNPGVLPYFFVNYACLVRQTATCLSRVVVGPAPPPQQGGSRLRLLRCFVLDR